MDNVVTVPKSPLDQQYCPKCRKTLKQSTNFYKHHSGEFDEMCRACLTMHIDPWDKDTYVWLMERFDIPYIEGEWTILRDKAYARDPIKFKAQAVFGKYMSKMKLKQWADKRWADTERLAEEAAQQAAEAGLSTTIPQDRIETIKQAYERGEISEAQYKTFAETLAPPEPKYVAPGSREELEEKLGIDGEKLRALQNPDPIPGGKGPSGMYPANSNFEEVELEDVGANLTQEDKIYLATKWGRFYKADEWVTLEKMYNNFMASFDIQGEARIDTLRKICKTSLKMDQAIDVGDVDSFQKLSRVYDTLMKSAKFNCGLCNILPIVIIGVYIKLYANGEV